MSGRSDDPADPAFAARRAEARQLLDRQVGAFATDREERMNWFGSVYTLAAGDPAAVPWADLAPKQGLADWLAEHPGEGRTAIDIGCGLGDNAEAIAAAGWRTTAFDLVPEAIEWAERRFPATRVDYRVTNLLELPAEWTGAFDLVHECYTLQALSGEPRTAGFAAVARLVARGGTLLVIARTRAEGEIAPRPPWPLSPSEIASFEALGLTRLSEHRYPLTRAGQVISPEGRFEFVRA